VIENALAFVEEDGAGFRENHSSTRTLEESCADTKLQVTDLPAQWGLGDIESLGSFSEMQLLRYGNEVAQMAKFKAEIG
jgi:hypothetical protein